MCTERGRFAPRARSLPVLEPYPSNRERSPSGTFLFVEAARPPVSGHLAFERLGRTYGAAFRVPPPLSLSSARSLSLWPRTRMHTSCPVLAIAKTNIF